LHFREHIASESLSYFTNAFIPAVRQHGLDRQLDRAARAFVAES
jgi:hypothetical protein